MKGFATIMVAASVFVIAILLLSNNPVENVSYIPNFSELKVRISNYEIVMLEAAQDCNWIKSVTEINTCLNENSQNLLPALNMPYTKCTFDNYDASKVTNSAITTINCLIEIDSKKEGYFSTHLTKIIKIKKYS